MQPMYICWIGNAAAGLTPSDREATAAAAASSITNAALIFLMTHLVVCRCPPASVMRRRSPDNLTHQRPPSAEGQPQRGRYFRGSGALPLESIGGRRAALEL